MASFNSLGVGAKGTFRNPWKGIVEGFSSFLNFFGSIGEGGMVFWKDKWGGGAPLISFPSFVSLILDQEPLGGIRPFWGSDVLCLLGSHQLFLPSSY